MKLYFAPGACSLSPHIVLREAGFDFGLEQVNNQEKKTKSGLDYWGVNAKGKYRFWSSPAASAYRRAGDRSVPRRIEARIRSSARQRQHATRARAGMAQFHNVGDP